MNVAFITGSLGADMEVSFTSNNTAIGKFSVATSDGYKDRDNNWVDKTTWHNITLFKPSEHKIANLKKGAKVAVRGKIDNYKYEVDGQNRYGSAIIVDSVEVITKADVNQGTQASPTASTTSHTAIPENTSHNDNDDLPF